MKKALVFLFIVIGLFVILGFVSKMNNDKASKESKLYGGKSLHPETVAQLKDPNYQNIILPGTFENKLKNHQDVTIYFYSPTCPHCKESTPIVVPLAKKMGVNLVLFNVLEFESAWDDYKIDGTPTIRQYKNGKLVAEITGVHTKEEYSAWFEQYSR